MFDLDFAKAKIDKKWNIGNFITSSYKTAKGVPVDPADIDLNKAINGITRDYGKTEKEYDSLYRDLMIKRTEIKKDIIEMKAHAAKYMDIVSAQGNDITVINTQLKLIEDKQRLIGDKYKTIQAEKKLAKDLSAGKVEAQPAVQNIISNNPLSVGSMASQLSSTPQVINMAPTAAPLPVVEHARIDFKQDNKPLEVPAEKELAIQPKEDIVLATDTLGNVTHTKSAQDTLNLELAKERLANKDKLLKKENLLGHKYNRSASNLIMDHIPHKLVLFLNPNTGRFWEKAYEQDANGDYTVESKRYQQRSVTHLGDLQFDIGSRQVTTYYDDTPIEFRLDFNESNMGDFYKSEWDHPKTEKFIISDAVCEQIAAALS